MGYGDHFDTGMQGGTGGGNPSVGVFLSARQAAAFGEYCDPMARVLFHVCEVAPTEALPGSSLVGLAVAVVEVDPSASSSVDRLVELSRANPGLPIIAAVHAPELGLVRTLVREGISDVIGLPVNITELTQACLDAVARRARPIVPVRKAPLVGIVKTNGGCGATTVATQLASACSQFEWEMGKTIVADLDVQFGSVATYLGVTRSGSLPDLIAAEQRIDQDLLKSIATETYSGLAVLDIPEDMPSIESISVDEALRVMDSLRGHYGLVVADFPSNWSNWSASIAFAADLLLITTELTINSIRHAKRCLDLFREVGIPSEKIAIVVNKAEKRMFRPIANDDIVRTLGVEVIATLPAELENLHAAQEQGLPVTSIAKRSPFGTAIGKLAEGLHSRLQEKRPS